LQAIVGHWEGIESGIHRVRDVSLREDRCRVSRPRAARNLLNLRNLAL
jgi:predicted transposase YbfD/YdcC